MQCPGSGLDHRETQTEHHCNCYFAPTQLWTSGPTFWSIPGCKMDENGTPDRLRAVPLLKNSVKNTRNTKFVLMSPPAPTPPQPPRRLPPGGRSPPGGGGAAGGGAAGGGGGEGAHPVLHGDPGLLGVPRLHGHHLTRHRAGRRPGPPAAQGVKCLVWFCVAPAALLPWGHAGARICRISRPGRWPRHPWRREFRPPPSLLHGGGPPWNHTPAGVGLQGGQIP